jgi:hypothetical protein
MKTYISIIQTGRTIKVSEITDRYPATDYCLGERNFTSAKAAVKYIKNKLSSVTTVQNQAQWQELQERAR